MSAAVSVPGMQHSTSTTRLSRRDTNRGRWVCMWSTPIVIDRFTIVSAAISGTARYQFVAAGTSRPKASAPAQPTMCMSGRTFAGCSSFNTRRLNGVFAVVAGADEACGRSGVGTGQFGGHGRASSGGGVECGELELRGEGLHRIGVAGLQPLQGAEGQMIGDHHAAYLGVG